MHVCRCVCVCVCVYIFVQLWKKKGKAFFIYEWMHQEHLIFYKKNFNSYFKKRVKSNRC